MLEYDGKMMLKDRRPCSGLRADLKMCILSTDCVQINKKVPLQCLRDNEVPQKCQVLANEFFECKRQLVDMRRRFREFRGY